MVNSALLSAATAFWLCTVISPPTTTRPVVQKVSQATRARLSWVSRLSSTASLTASLTLSGWPIETDSEVKK